MAAPLERSTGFLHVSKRRMSRNGIRKLQHSAFPSRSRSGNTRPEGEPRCSPSPSSSPSWYLSPACPLLLCRSGSSRGRRAGLLLFRRGSSCWLTLLVIAALACIFGEAGALIIEGPFEASFDHVAAAFGPDALLMDPLLESRLLVKARPRDACTSLTNTMDSGAVALVARGTCNFTQKVLHAQEAGASAVVVTDNRSTDRWFMVMFGDAANTQGIDIPAILVSRATGERLWNTRSWLPTGRLRASINETGHIVMRPPPIGTLETLGIYIILSVMLLAFSGICGMLFALAYTWYQRGYRTRAMQKLKLFTYRRRKPPAGDTAADSANSSSHSHGGGAASPKRNSTQADGNGTEGAGAGGDGAEDINGMRAEDDMCAICLDAYEEGDSLTGLPCRHSFHTHCIRPWLSGKSGLCPMCKGEAFARGGFLATPPRLEAAFAELAVMCTDNLAVLGLFFLASVAAGVIAAKLALRD